MDEDESLHYPDTFVIGGVERMGQRGAGEKEVLIPYAGAVEVEDGDVIRQKAGKGYTELRVLEVHPREGGNLGSSERPNLLTLIVENLTAAQHRTPRQAGVSIINAGAVVVGDNNVQNINIRVQDLVQQVAKKGDAEAKGALAKFFCNSTVSAILGGSVVELLKKALAG